jgi:hypothetical protein
MISFLGKVPGFLKRGLSVYKKHPTAQWLLGEGIGQGNEHIKSPERQKEPTAFCKINQILESKEKKAPTALMPSGPFG